MNFHCDGCRAPLASLNTVCPKCGRWNDAVRLAPTKPQPITEADREYMREALARLNSKETQ
jgi:hypothetical protein